MKINAINNDKYNTPKNSTNKNNPSFSARVQYYKELKDVVTDEVINIEHGPLRMLMDKITPYLQNLEDDNLIVTISGAQKKPEFWDIFRTGEPIRGLKFDLNYFDLKRFYNKFMADKDLPKFLHPQILEGFKRKDDALMETLGETIGVGKVFRPDKGETPEQYIAEVIPKIKEHLRLMPALITSKRNDLKFDSKLGRYVRVNVPDTGERKPWNLYRGIEFDYPTIGFEDTSSNVRQVI